MDEQQQWYVTIAGNAVGPVSTDLVLRGIKHKKIATEAYVCVVGADKWQALTDVPEFHGALKEHGLLPEVPKLDGQPKNGAEISLADIAAAQAHAAQQEGTEVEQAQALQPESPEEAAQAHAPQPESPEEVAQAHAMQLVRDGVARLLAHPPESADALKNADEEDESDATAPFSNRPMIDLPPMYVEPPATVQATRNEQSEITQAAALLPSRPAPEVAIHEAADSASQEAIDLSDEAAHSESSIPGEPRNGKHVDVHVLSRAPMHSIDIDVDFSVDEPREPTIDWNQGFADYFLVDAAVTLPDQDELLLSLTTTPHGTFLNDEAMWNLALCLAFGSNAVASVAADVFFDVVAKHEQYDRIEWMARTLLSRGFMPSGIPHPAGNMGIGRLRQACPGELLMQLESQLGI